MKDLRNFYTKNKRYSVNVIPLVFIYVFYFAFNNMISVCEEGHAFYGNECPKCGKPKIDTFQRIVGYLVPSSNYSKERLKEFKGRYWYDLNDGLI